MRASRRAGVRTLPVTLAGIFVIGRAESVNAPEVNVSLGVANGLVTGRFGPVRNHARLMLPEPPKVTAIGVWAPSLRARKA